MIEVVQVFPMKNYDLILYFVDGNVKKYNIAHLIGEGVFSALKDIDFYMERCTVLNHTVAWSLDGKYDPMNCIDLDPDVLYEEGVSIKDPLEKIA
jgi:hypothetical protein